MAKRPKFNKEEARMVRNLDDLAEFQRFQETILPVLRKAIAEKWSAEKLWSDPTTQALLAAQAVRVGLNNADPGKALAAINSIMDRTQGKPTEKQEIVHKVEKLKDEELNALLETHLADIGFDDDTKLN